uniref:Uncharacterized protein n=1 Tax=Thalassionema nitzschioides TaxID=33649 RepID=A0A7S1H6I3_9STRA|mmetsp:Transcript_9750/g.8001  ORF Transcript_9750/g.8001 Transcript_9750/m.8001 type:complete len:101 (+) Transcript_9750:51-353(+)
MQMSGKKLLDKQYIKWLSKKKNKSTNAASKMEEMDEDVNSVSEQNRSEAAAKAATYRAAQLHKTNVKAKNAARPGGEKKVTPSKRALSSSSASKQKKTKG